MQDQKYFTYPLDVLETPAGVQLARGANRFAVRGDRAAGFLRLIVALSAEGVARAALLEEFAEADREVVGNLLDTLVERKFAYYADEPSAEYGAESPQDLFVWHFPPAPRSYATALASVEIVLVGVNLVSLNLRDALLRSGFEQVSFVDDPLLRNVRLFDDLGKPSAIPELESLVITTDELVARYGEGGDDRFLLVPCSEFGGHTAILPWNRLALQHGWHMLPVMLSSLRGRIGPYIVPPAAPCYECLIGRENANLNDPAEERALDDHAHETQLTTAAYTESMLMSLAGMAAMELSKLVGGLMLFPTGELLDIAFLEPSIRRHAVLKIPRCPSCSPTEWRPAVSISRDEFRNKLIANS